MTNGRAPLWCELFDHAGAAARTRLPLPLLFKATTIVGGMRLRDYLPTRTFELAVHTADLAMAVGVPPHVPATAARQALHVVTDLAVDDGLAGPLLLAATGRPADFSVL